MPLQAAESAAAQIFEAGRLAVTVFDREAMVAKNPQALRCAAAEFYDANVAGYTHATAAAAT